MLEASVHCSHACQSTMETVSQLRCPRRPLQLCGGGGLQRQFSSGRWRPIQRNSPSSQVTGRLAVTLSLPLHHPWPASPSIYEATTPSLLILSTAADHTHPLLPPRSLHTVCLPRALHWELLGFPWQPQPERLQPLTALAVHCVHVFMCSLSDDTLVVNHGVQMRVVIGGIHE